MSKCKKQKCICLNCEAEFYKWYSSNGKFCNNTCSSEYFSKQRYKKIIDGDISIMRSNYSPTNVAYKYIMDEQFNKCCICGNIDKWENKNIKFIVDHIDGDASNNIRTNLRCICPNCDSQLDTYKNTNSRRSSRTYRNNL